MNPDVIDIEWIVAEVVRRISAHANPRDDAPQPTDSAPAREAVPRDVCVIDQRVVTLATLPSDLGKIRTVKVVPRAVITPAVKDHLRKHGIQLVVRAEATSTTQSSTGIEVVLSSDDADAGRIARTLVQLVDLQAVELRDLAQAVEHIGQVVSDPQRAVIWLTDQPLAAVCLANRIAVIRAAAGTTGTEARQAIETIAANLLVVNPRQVNSIQWKNIVQQFQSGLPRTCPAVFQPSR